MEFDFTTVYRRYDASALDAVGTRPGRNPDLPKEGFDIIPMWVADMNFPTAPSVTRAIQKRTEHPFYGYFVTSDEYYRSIMWWHRTRYGTEDLRQEYIGYENGVIGGVAQALATFASPGDAVLIHTPAYLGFTGTIRDVGLRMVTSELVKDDDGIYRMDFDDMDRRIRENHIHLAIFCSPHNPTGRVWERWELEQALEVYRRNEVIVICDEIWADLIFPGHRHIPFQSLSGDARQRTIALYAPTKTFNLAGLTGSYHVIYNPLLRDRLQTHSHNTHYNSMNVLSMHALTGAYCEEGAEWTDELCQVLEKNAGYACDYFRNRLEGVEVTMPDGTYMLLPDCAGYLRQRGITLDELLRRGYEVGVAWQDGRLFYAPTHIRMNLALPFTRIEEAFDRLDRYVFR